MCKPYLVHFAFCYYLLHNFLSGFAARLVVPLVGIKWVWRTYLFCFLRNFVWPIQVCLKTAKVGSTDRIRINSALTTKKKVIKWWCLEIHTNPLPPRRSRKRLRLWNHRQRTRKCLNVLDLPLPDWTHCLRAEIVSINININIDLVCYNELRQIYLSFLFETNNHLFFSRKRLICLSKPMVKEFCVLSLPFILWQ